MTARTPQTGRWRPQRVDLAIITALTDELKPVLRWLKGGHGYRMFGDGPDGAPFLHHYAEITIGSRTLAVVVCALWQMGQRSTSSAVGRMANLKPQLIAMTGICAGYAGKGIQRGDVVVATRAFDADSGKRTDGGIRYDTDSAAPPPWLITWLQALNDDDSWYTKIGANKPSRRSPQVHFGTFATTAQVAEVEQPFTELERRIRSVRAIEMEVMALYQAAAEGNLRAIAVKGVTDHATPGKNDRYRSYAAEASLRWLIAFLELAADYLFEPGGSNHAHSKHDSSHADNKPPRVVNLPTDAGRLAINLTPLLDGIYGSALSRYGALIPQMIEQYTAVFGGRSGEFKILDDWLEQESKPFAFLHDLTGRGKTALLLNWSLYVHQRGDWHVIFVPISLRYKTSELENALQLLLGALASFYNDLKRYDDLDKSNSTTVRAEIENYLRREPIAGKRMLIILDGLDEIEGEEVDDTLFPDVLPKQIRVISSARQIANRTYTQWLDRLGWQDRRTRQIELPLLGRSAIVDILHKMGDPLDKFVDRTDVDVIDQIERISQGQPFMIRLLIDRLLASELSADSLHAFAASPDKVLLGWLEELQTRGSQARAVGMLLRLCAIAHGPLSVEDLESLAPDELAERDQLNEATKAVRRYIVGDGVQQGYVFSHPYVQQLYAERLLSRAQRLDLQRRFVGYGQRWYDNRNDGLPDYLRQFWIAHLAACRREHPSPWHARCGAQ